jgi:hypothetical protein
MPWQIIGIVGTTDDDDDVFALACVRVSRVRVCACKCVMYQKREGRLRWVGQGWRIHSCGNVTERHPNPNGPSVVGRRSLVVIIHGQMMFVGGVAARGVQLTGCFVFGLTESYRAIDEGENG